ncbi:uncharacterized protein [Henckelia pumila]|uniref:uncharacterized protein n=1 Tax=Henckelia pumila TaxID=405737 RepID=UPI003C6E0771
MASAEDDFTFPAAAAAATTANSQPRFIGSPPLWRHLAASSQNSELLSELGEQEEEEDQEKSNIKEFKASSSNSIDHRKENAPNDDEEEKMDMLWEDLNEEFSRNSGKIPQKISTEISSPGRAVQVRCIKAMKLSKANGKKSNILVFIKIVKRAFAIHNSRRSIKKHGKYF